MGKEERCYSGAAHHFVSSPVAEYSKHESDSNSYHVIFCVNCGMTKEIVVRDMKTKEA